MKHINFQVHSLGCKVNQYDGADLQRRLVSAGFHNNSQPDFVIINTCSVTKKAILKDRQLITKLKHKYPLTRLVVMGCWPQTDRNVKEGLGDDNIILWGVGNLEGLVEKLKMEFELAFSCCSSDINNVLAPTDRSRYFLKISDGCDQFCSYCIIPHARGRMKSRTLISLTREAEAASLAGYREIILSGIHLGRYGEDFKNSKINLTYLLEKLLKIKELGRLRLSSIEINEVTDDLIKLIAKESRICKHLHISLQSGSTKILHLMNRPYTASYYKNRVLKIKREIPDIAISTDIIVGFPQESEEYFLDTYNLAQDIAFSKIHVFPFSAHEITAAYRLADKVSGVIIKQRAKKLRELSLCQEKDYQDFILKMYKNKPLNLIKEKSDKSGFIRAKTEYGFDIYLNKLEAKRHIFL
jgi:threonylcarbamoyladenosine tRNA methylthiotransferase MtaB